MTGRMFAQGEISNPYPVKDVVRCTVSPVIRCSDFRKEALRTRPDEDDDAKQAVADRVMSALADLHARADQARTG